ncbi:hypothetical protein PV325_003565 [Microctonus aethiopoides]|uniref:Uncharacterized protein n=1 Tax=Microctonus aethiopoides TaxID=144406 RepID=A0AA39KL10_9HYME|nr:hypothetical protein PV325_003565 [Microctonus aethiopoides]KAK0095761.1 hypothetical protein PV326_007454 [Microctonus aethiopoides]KAK0165267.1 hypothetical protein PV328_003798 [Microctonus aethiopoides]
MIHVSSQNNYTKYDRVKRKGVAFLFGLFKIKQLGVGMKINGDDEMERTPRIETPALPSRIPSSLSVAAVDVVLTPAVCNSSPSHSILTLTPGRTRNIDQDMEALRLSRQDNPFLQILASRESLIESIDESESDDAILMSQELGDADPLTLAQVHEHLVRSPPPASWPHAPTFAFNSTSNSCGSSTPTTCHKDSPSKSNYYKDRTSDTGLLSQSEPSSGIRDRQTHSFSLLNPTPIRTLSEVRRLHRSADDNVQLMSSE